MANSIQSEQTHASKFERMQQLSIYIKETDHVDRRPLYLSILKLVQQQGMAGATVLKGVAGYSASSRSIRSAGFADIQQQLPMLVIIVDTAPKLQAIHSQLEEWVEVNGGLITLLDLEGHCFLHPHAKKGGSNA